MKKIISLLCALALIAGLSCVAVSADEEVEAAPVTIALIADEFHEGDTEINVYIGVVADEGLDVTAFGAVVGYDAEALTLTAIENVSGVEGSFLVGSEAISANPQNIIWVSGTDALPADACAAKLTFAINAEDGATLEDAYEITLEALADGNVSSVDGHDYTSAGEVAFEGVTAQATVAFNRGDLDGDGKYTAMDTVLLLRVVAGWTNPCAYPEAGDMNGDGIINAQDAVYHLRALNGWSDYTFG